MAAPVSVVHTHVHSIRLASGAEALVARVSIKDGTAGHGFSLGLDAAVARDMAAWDAHARASIVPLWRLLGRKESKIAVSRDEEPGLTPDGEKLRRAMRGKGCPLLRIDPFAWGSLEVVQTIAAAAAELNLPLALLAPNGHPWEIAWCAALAGASGRVIVHGEPASPSFALSSEPGSGIAWLAEPAFASIRWLAPATEKSGRI